jgi:hypothetical protein
MTIEFDDLIPSNTSNIEFDDLIPQGPSFTDQLANGVRALFGNIVTPFNAPEKIGRLANTFNPPEPTGSVFERVPVERAPFSFARASAVQRAIDDQLERQAQYGTVGPIVGPQPSVGSVATGLVSDLVSGGKAARAGVNQMAGDITGSEYLLDKARREAAQAELMRAVNTPNFETDTARGIYSGVSSTIRQLPAIAAAVATRNPNVALGGMVAPMVPEEYGKFRQRGANPLPALAGAVGTAGTEYITEKLPMSFLVNQFGRAGAGQFLTGLLAREVPGEQVATIVQDAIDTAIANPDKTWGDYLAERPGAAYQTLLATLTQGGIMGGANAVATRLTGQQQPPEPTLADYQEAARRVFGRTTPAAPAPAPAPAQAPAPTAPPEAEVVNRILQAIEQTQNVQNVPPAQRAETQAPPVEAPAPAAGDATAPVGVPAESAAPDVEASGLTFDDLVPPEGEAQAPQPVQQSAQAPQPVTQPAQPGTTGEGAGGSRPTQVAPILQNRNRATPSSIAQMQSIATQPDYGRLGFSRDFANGAPVVAGGQIAPEQLGRTDVAVASDGRRIPVQYAVVEASDVLPSNQADGTPNPDYGNQSVQRIRAIAGNGRIAGLQLAYRKGTTPGYLNELASDTLHGVSPDVIRAMRAPVLVRVMPTDQVTADIGDVSNTVGNLNLSAVEQASNDAQRVNLETLSFAEDGSITPEAVRQFVRAMPQAEQGGLIDTNGQPTKQAVDRINAAVFAKAYGNEQLIRLFAQAQDPEARNVLSALAQVAPKMARLEGAGALDIRGVVTQAAEIAVNARREGKAISLAAQQLDLAADPMVGVVLDLFARNSRTVKPVVEALSNAADLAYTEANKPAEDMFGEVPRASRQDVINQLRPQNERASQENLEQSAGREPVQVDAGRAEADTPAATDPAATEAGRPAEAERFPSVATVTGLSVGPGGTITPRVIAPGRPLYRETNADGLDDILRLDGQAHVAGYFVTDNPDLALGQGDNRGVQVVFRPDALSGQENRKPGTGDIAGREYKTDIVAPRAVQSVTMKAADAKRLRGLTRRVLLTEFDRQDIGGGLMQFQRKGLPTQQDAAAQGEPVQQQTAQQEQAAPTAEAEPLLTSPTQADIEQRLERLEQAQRDQERADRETAETERQRQEREEVRRRSEAAADTFELGQDPMANLSGQRDIFSAPAQPSNAQDSGPEIPVNESRPAPSAKPIEDAGQKIGGARKDRWKERGLNLDDLDSMSEAEGAELATKANVWKPDYEALSEAAEPVTAAMVKVIYDRLAAKPAKNTPEGRRLYVRMMRIVREVYTEAKGPEAVKNAFMEIRQRVGLNTMDPQAKADARALLFSVYKGRSDPFTMDFSDLSKAKKMVEDGFPGKGEPWKTRLLVSLPKGGPGTTESGFKLYEEQSAKLGTPLTREQIEAGFFLVVDKKNKVLAFAPTKEDAEAAAKTIYERDMKGGKDGKPEPERPHLDELKRENLPQRIDRDVTTEDFIRDFGFRGVEFGNWSAQDERQRIINMAYDGLMDLAEIMGVPPKAMSLNGSLGMAFGARGGGRFLAHYEPGKLVINMTKLRGGGSLAHEWAHAMDHYFGELDTPDAYTTKARGASGWYDEDQYNGIPRKRMEQVDGKWKSVEKTRLENLRPELSRAFDEVMRALFQKQINKAEMVRSQELGLERTEALANKEQDAEMKAMYRRMATNKRQALEELRRDPEDTMYAGRGRSEFAQQAQALSGKSANGYWARPTEMFARAFESWVFDRVTAMGARSDYLVHGVEADRFAGGGYKGNPYPTGEERARINAAFEKLVGTIQTRETEQGIALFEPEAAYNAEAPRRTYTDDRQLQLFLDNGPDASQAGPRGEAAQREAVSAVDDLRSTETLLGLALSRDYAARQRAGLVGQQVSSAEDLAVLAQVYRDPRFETFRVVFVNDSGKVVSQVGLTSRLPASTQAIMGNDVQSYLNDLSATARNRGATGFYMLHNHPSGIASPSMADRSLTQTFAQMMPSLQFKSHVVIDTNEYSVIDGQGRSETLKKDFGQPAPYRAQEWADVQISGPQDLMSMAKRLQVDNGAITLIHTNNQYGVKAITTIPASASTMDKQELRKLVVKASLQTQGAQVFAVGRDSQALRRIGPLVVDAIYVEDSGKANSLRSMGVIPGGSPFPETRRTRVSPDTSPEFAYLRRQPQPAASLRVAEPGMDQTRTPEFKRWFGDSKVVDEQGRPLVVYHGTTKSFDAFSFEYGPAFFTDNPAAASEYTKDGRRTERGANLMPVYLSFQNPKIVDYSGEFDNNIVFDVEDAKDEGFDSLIVRNAHDGRSVIDQYVAFNPIQIKSAIGNNGQFDPTDQSIVREDGPQYNAEPSGQQSPNRDALGRLKFRLGEVALGKLDAATRPLQEKFGMRMASPELRKQLRQMKATIEEAKRAAVDVAKEMNAMPEADRAMVSDIVEKMIAPGVVPPEHAVKVADAITRTMDQQTDELVALGMLSADSADRWRGRYLPRIYNRQTELADDPLIQRLFKTGTPTMAGIGGGSLKGRGLFQDVSVDAVDQWLAMGYEVRDPHWKLVQGKLELKDPNAPKVARDQVTVWRDWTPSERAQMGENRDAMYRFVMGYTAMQRDIALGRLFNNIANNTEWVRRSGAEGWVPVPTTEIPDTGGVKRYGNLAGLFVRRDVMSHLTQFEEAANDTLQLYREALGLWKEGKALALDTPIPTPGGWKTMGDLQVGDVVFDERGEPCNVTYVTDTQLNRECYELEFSDGTKIVADAEHLWFTIYHGKGSVKNTLRIIETLKERTRGDNKHSIPVAGALQLPDAALPVPPYALGAWLGDGNSHGARITVGADDAEETMGLLRQCGIESNDGRKDPRGNVWSYGIRFATCGPRRCDGLQPKLRELGVIANKHIPAIYLRASEAQRRELLCGLMDTDGHITAAGKCEFSTTSEALRDGMMELLRSLGYKPAFGEQVGRVNGKACSKVWRIKFQAFNDKPVFKLARKVARLRDRPASRPRSGTRQIVAIRPVASVPVKCITVDSPNRLYLAGDGMVPTHNTALNPVAHFNNIMSNVSMAHFAGVSYWDGHKYVNAARDLVNDAPMVDEARKVGLFTGSFTQEEMVQAMPPELQKLANMEEGKARKTGRYAMNALTWMMRRPLRKAYEFEDTFFKYLIYRDARQQGMEPGEAMDYALRYIFTYDDLPSGARKVRDFAIPFFSWTYKAMPALLHTAMVYPWRFLAPAAALHGINAVAYALAAGDEDDNWLEKIAKGQELEKEEREVLPDRMQGMGALANPKSIRLGTDELTGHPIYLDASRVIPGGDMFDMVNQAGGIALPAPLMPNHPILSAFSAMIANKEMFFGRDITDRNDTSGEAAEKRAKWMAGFLLPAVSPGGYHSQRILDATANAMDTVITTPLGEFTGVDRSGLPVQPKFAAMQTVGIKARPVDLELEAQRRRAQEAALVNSIAAEVRSMARLYQRGAVSDEMMDRTRERAREKIERIREGETP